MAIRRYGRTSLIASGTQYSTPEAVVSIRRAVKSGAIPTIVHVCVDNERLDIIAGKRYGNAKLWWVIAAASDIGWALQVPPGTRLLIPTSLNSIAGYVS